MNLHDALLNRTLLGGSGGSGGAVIVSNVASPKKTLSLDSFEHTGKWKFPVATSVGDSAFSDCTSLISVDMPAATSVGNSAFYGCKNLISIDIPVATSIESFAFTSTGLISVNFPMAASVGSSAFSNCTSLTSADFPMVISIGRSAFSNCKNLTLFDFPVATSIESYAFQYCSQFTTLILRSSTMCTLSNVNAFINTPIAAGTGYIYVPSALIEEYKVATNWSTFAAQFRALEDYTVDGTITGELDWDKVAAA